LKLFNYFWLKFVKVSIENPAALHFILQDDIFLLSADKNQYKKVDIAADATAVTDIPEALSDIAPVASVSPVAYATAIQYLGANKKDFVILVHYPEIEFISATHLTSLENILKRKGFELDDVAIVNMATCADANFETLKDHLKPQRILFMGKDALPGGLAPLKLNQLQQLGNCTALYSFSFDEMMESNEHKKAFWDQMKLL